MTAPFDAAGISEETLRRLFGWWSDARGAERYPARDAFDPMAEPSRLGSLLMVETADALEAFRYRVFGTDAADAFGEERTGKRFDHIRLPDRNEGDVLTGYWAVYCDGVPHYFPNRPIAQSRAYAGYSRLLLPLGPDRPSGGPSRILGAFAFFPRR